MYNISPKNFSIRTEYLPKRSFQRSLNVVTRGIFVNMRYIQIGVTPKL